MITFADFLTQMESYQSFQKGSVNITSFFCLNFRELKNEQAFLLSQRSWLHVKRTYLRYSNLNDNSLFHLSKANLPQLEYIDLSLCKISIIGGRYLSQTNWNQLQAIQLENNNLGNLGIKFLTKGHWNVLKAILLKENYIGNQGMNHLCKANWPQLIEMQLSNNLIGVIEIKFLILGKFELESLNLRFNRISTQAKYEIMRIDRHNLQRLELNSKSMQRNQPLGEASRQNLMLFSKFTAIEQL